jgi:AcrR family transcriptional regulator
MTDKSRSKRQPAETRRRLLDVAFRLAEQTGITALTLEAVAAEASVSKGGLLHHFPSKHALIAGMMNELMARLTSQIATAAEADPVAEGRHARAYVTAVAEETHEEARRWLAVIAALLLDPALLGQLKTASADWLERDRAEAADPTGALVARLAADGLWLADVLGLYPIDQEARGRVVARLKDLTRSNA